MNLSAKHYDNFIILMTANQEMKDIVQNSESGENSSDYSAYNLRLIKSFITKAKFTLVFIAVIWVMYIIQCIFTWVTVSTAFGFTTIPGVVLVELGGNVSLLVKLGQIYRLFSAIFLHGGIMHIMMNTGSLFAFCMELESNVAKKFYIGVFLIGGIQGNMLSDLYHINLGNSLTVGVGASTSICAIMGLYIAKLYLNSKITGQVQFAKRQIVTMLVSLLLISILPQVDFFGHFGSLISGALMGAIIFGWENAELKRYSKYAIGGLSIYTIVLMTIFV